MPTVDTADHILIPPRHDGGEWHQRGQHRRDCPYHPHGDPTLKFVQLRIRCSLSSTVSSKHPGHFLELSNSFTMSTTLPRSARGVSRTRWRTKNGESGVAQTLKVGSPEQHDSVSTSHIPHVPVCYLFARVDCVALWRSKRNSPHA